VSDLIRRPWRNPAYERTISRVRKALKLLAPELVEHNTSPSAVKLRESSKVYRRLAARYHPDHGGDRVIMMDFNELWQAVQADIGQR
jgi:hypothetical protein